MNAPTKVLPQLRADWVASFAAAAVAVIPASVERVLVEAYAPVYAVPATVVGAAYYKRVSSEPTHDLKFVNGGWWEIDEPKISIEMAGATTDAADNRVAIERAATAAIVLRRTLRVPAAAYRTTGNHAWNSIVVEGEGMFSGSALVCVNADPASKLIALGAVAHMSDLKLCYDASIVIAGAASGQFVGLKCGSDVSLCKGASVRRVAFQHVGTALHDASPQPTFSVSFADIDVRDWTYALIDFTSDVRTQNSFSNIYGGLHPGGRNIAKYGFNFEGSDDTGMTLDCVNLESTRSDSAFRFVNCRAVTMASFHAEDWVATTTGCSLVEMDRSSMVIGRASVYYCVLKDDCSLFGLGSAKYQEGGGTTQITNNMLAIDLLSVKGLYSDEARTAKVTSSTGIALFRRDVSEAAEGRIVVNVEQYSPYAYFTDDLQWYRSFVVRGDVRVAKSGNLRPSALERRIAAVEDETRVSGLVSIAHRGFGKVYPENTLLAFRAAMSQKIPAIPELDVHVSSDGYPVVFHDYDLDATTDGTGAILSTPLATIQAATYDNLGIPLSGFPASELKIPLFSDCVSLFVQSGVRFIPEIKDPTNGAVDAMLAVVDAAGAADLVYGWSGANMNALQYVRSVRPFVKIIWGTQNAGTLFSGIDTLAGLGNSAINVELSVLAANPSVVAYAAAAGVDVMVWTIGTQAQAAQAAALGARYIYTDIPLTPAIMGKNTAEAPADGWELVGDVATYGSATTLTVPGDQRGRYQPGTKLRVWQGTAQKFFAVVASSYAGGVTTVTFTGGTDYTLSNAAITRLWYSRAAAPLGYPRWFSYTPTYGGFSASPGQIMRFAIDGHDCIVQYRGPSNGTSNANSFTISAPVASANVSGSMLWAAMCAVVDDGAFFVGLATIANAASLIQFERTPGAGFSSFTASGNKRASSFELRYRIA